MKTYFILINPDHVPREGWLGAVISRHYSMAAALDRQDQVHRDAEWPITTAIYSNHFMPRTDQYLAAGYGGPEIRTPVHVRTILKD
jgi:hypothetical protein